jgi:hypothetical protein
MLAASVLTGTMGVILSASASERAAPGPLGPVVDEVVLTAGERFVTRSDLELEARVVLIAGGGLEAAFAPITEEVLESVMDYLVNQMLILAEVERLQVFEVGSEEVSAEIERFVSAFPERGVFEAFLAAQDVGAERIGAILRRNLRVQRFLESRVKLTVRVDEDEVVAFFAENAERFPGRSLDEVREVIRGHLFRQRFEDAVARLVADLEQRTEVVVLSRPAGLPAALPPAPSPARESLARPEAFE